MLLLRHFVFKTDEIPAALMLWGMIWLGGLVVLYVLLTVAERFFETSWFRRSLKHGQGGSARWGGSGVFAKYEWSQVRSGSAPIHLGRTLDKFDPRLGGRDIGIDDESHLVTLAQSGSGKSTTVIWPNLVKYAYPDSVFVLDPKGEHARNTSKHRAAQGQRVIVLAPFSLPATEGLPTHGFNPLAHIDVNSDRATEDINAIADACVIPSTKSDSTTQHFERLQRAMISGIIAHTLTTEPTSHHNLPFVYERLMDLGTDEHFIKFLEQMRANRSCGDLPRRAVTLYERAGKNEKGSIFTTTIGNIEWVASTGMRKLLLGNDFQISQLRTELISLYVVLDFDAMKPDAQGRFMRVLMNLAFTACRMTPLPAERAHRRTLFILDEVAQVGTMPSLQSAYQTLRSYHVKIWSFYQQWSSLSSQVEETSAITGNATKQFFGCEDMVTAEQIEKFLDKYRHHDGARELQRQLLSAGEVYDLLGQKDMVQIAITGQGDKLQLTRESFIPLGWTPPEVPEEGVFSSWPILARMGITALLACFLLGSFLIIYIEILIPILNMIGLSEEVIKGTGGQWIGGVFFFVFCALTFFCTREVWRRLFRGGRFNFPETLSVVPRSEQKPHLRDIVRTVGIFSVLCLLIAGVALIWFEVPKWVFVLFLSPFFIDVILGFLEEQHDKQLHVIVV